MVQAMADQRASGRVRTFNLALSDRKAEGSDFRFYAPRVFVGVDVYNGGTSASTLTIHVRSFARSRSPSSRES